MLAVDSRMPLDPSTASQAELTRCSNYKKVSIVFFALAAAGVFIALGAVAIFSWPVAIGCAIAVPLSFAILYAISRSSCCNKPEASSLVEPERQESEKSEKSENKVVRKRHLTLQIQNWDRLIDLDPGINDNVEKFLEHRNFVAETLNREFPDDDSLSTNPLEALFGTEEETAAREKDDAILPAF